MIIDWKLEGKIRQISSSKEGEARNWLRCRGRNFVRKRVGHTSIVPKFYNLKIRIFSYFSFGRHQSYQHSLICLPMSVVLHVKSDCTTADKSCNTFETGQFRYHLPDTFQNVSTSKKS